MQYFLDTLVIVLYMEKTINEKNIINTFTNTNNAIYRC